MKAKIKATNPFRVKKANELYNKIASNSDVYEYGIDTNGKIYFAYINGNVKRFTRPDFIKMSRAQ